MREPRTITGGEGEWVNRRDRTMCNVPVAGADLPEAVASICDGNSTTASTRHPAITALASSRATRDQIVAIGV